MYIGVTIDTPGMDIESLEGNSLSMQQFGGLLAYVVPGAETVPFVSQIFVALREEGRALPALEYYNEIQYPHGDVVAQVVLCATSASFTTAFNARLCLLPPLSMHVLAQLLLLVCYSAH